MRTPEERAEISRRNGAKSKGPVTPEGKSRSRRNAITHGDRATTLRQLVPPHSAVLCSELRQEFYDIVDKNIARYKPVDSTERRIVREISDCEWKITRACQLENSFWNKAYLLQPNPGPSGVPELAQLEAHMGAVESLAANPVAVKFLQDDIRRLTHQIGRCERRLVRLRKEFPCAGAGPLDSLADRATYDYPGLGLVPQDASDDSERTCADGSQDPPQETETKEKEDTFNSAGNENFVGAVGSGAPEIQELDREIEPGIRLLFVDQGHQQSPEVQNTGDPAPGRTQKPGGKADPLKPAA